MKQGLLTPARSSLDRHHGLAPSRGQPCSLWLQRREGTLQGQCCSKRTGRLISLGPDLGAPSPTPRVPGLPSGRTLLRRCRVWGVGNRPGCCFPPSAISSFSLTLKNRRFCYALSLAGERRGLPRPGGARQPAEFYCTNSWGGGRLC